MSRSAVLIIGTLSGMDHTEKGQGKTASLATPLVVTLGDGELLHTPHTWTCAQCTRNVLPCCSRKTALTLLLVRG